jgi:hypothetical protein
MFIRNRIVRATKAVAAIQATRPAGLAIRGVLHDLVRSV